MARAYLSLGSNLQAPAHLRAAAAALRARFGGVVLSRIYVTPAVGFEGAAFHNAAAVIDTRLDPVTLDAWLHALEDAHGRDRSGPRFSDRTLDIDLVLYEDDHGTSVTLDGPGHLRLPREDLRHAFVLKPLAEIAPDAVVPGDGRALAALWEAHPDRTRAFAAVDWDALPL